MELSLSIIINEIKGVATPKSSDYPNAKFSDIRLLDIEERVNASLSRTSATVLAAMDCRYLYLAAHEPLSLVWVDSSAPHNVRILELDTHVKPFELFTRLQDAFSRYRQWEQAMDRILFQEDDPLQQLLTISEPFLINHVVVVDAALKLLAYTVDTPCDDPITQELIKRGYHTEQNIARFRLNKRFKPWATQHGFIINDTRSICPYTTVVRTIKNSEGFSLIVVMMCNLQEPDQSLLDTYELFFARIRTFARYRYPQDKPSGTMADEFLRDLMNGTFSDETALRTRARYAHIPDEGPYCVFAVSLGSAATVPQTCVLLDVAIQVAPSNALFSQRKTEIIVLCYNCHDPSCKQRCNEDACPLKRVTTTQRLQRVLTTYELVAGRSSMFSKLADAPKALRQARIAERLIRTGKRRGAVNDRILGYDTCFAYNLLAQCSPGEEELIRMTPYMRMLAALKKEDREGRTNNFDLLISYFRNEQSTSHVAEEMHMHRNSVRNRINRIQQEYDIDVSDPDTRTHIMIAYFIFDALER